MPAFEALDYLEIQRLLNLFNLRFDAGDADGFAALFTEDAMLDVPSGPCATHDERREKVLGSLGRPPHRHFTTNIVIEPDAGDPARASSTACWLYVELRDDGVELRSFGTYTDDLVKRRGRWLIRRRTARSDRLVA